MSSSPDWRDVYCGRDDELKQLIGAYDGVTNGAGPRLAVVCAERGMGKTRLVQELYRKLSSERDPDDYWPDASLFTGNNLRVAPDFNDPQTKAHFASFTTAERPMPFLWWGFRLNDPQDRNAIRSDMAGHRRTLDPHLVRVIFAREQTARISALKHGVKSTAKDALLGICEALTDVCGAGALKTIFEVARQLRETGRDHVAAIELEEHFKQKNIAELEKQHASDIYQRTLDGLSGLLKPTDQLARLPAVVFCDDAQFARDGGDEGALFFLEQLWHKATEEQWPMLLVATHWAVDWDQDRQNPNESFAKKFSSIADDNTKSTIIRLSTKPDFRPLVAECLPALPQKDVDLLRRKADGNPQVLIELLGLIQSSPAWQAKGSLTGFARGKLETLNCQLTTLITNRLNSPATPDDVKVAVALSSLQGMQFLGALTEAASEALNRGPTSSGLSKAANPHRLIVGLEAGVASFVQRAYRDAAQSLVESQLGDPKEVEDGVLQAALGIIDDKERWEMLDADKQCALLGVMASLAEVRPDQEMQLRAGKALVKLVDLATDKAQRAAYAKRFSAGLNSKWPIDAFHFRQLDSVRCAVGEWYGFGTTVELSESILHWVRARRSDSVDGHADLQAALLAASEAHADRGDYRKAWVLRKEWVEPLRDRAKSKPTPENIEAICDALGELRWIAHFMTDSAHAGEEAAVLLEVIAIRRRQWDQSRTSEASASASASARKALISALDEVSARTPLAEMIKRREEIVRLRRDIVAEPADQAGDSPLELAGALGNLAGNLHKAGQQAACAYAWSESLRILRDLCKRLPSEERVAERLVCTLKTAAEQTPHDLPHQRTLLLEAVNLLAEIRQLVEAKRNPHEDMRFRHGWRHERRHDHDELYELQAALARNAAASRDWDAARDHFLQALPLTAWRNVAELSQEIQSQLPSGVYWPSIDQLKAKFHEIEDPVLDDLRQRLHTAPDESWIPRERASALSERVDEHLAAGLLDAAASMALECHEIESDGNDEPGHRYHNTVRCYRALAEGFRTEKRFKEALDFANRVVELLRADAVPGHNDGLGVADALGTASEIAEAAGQLELACKLADESLAITRRVVEDDRQSNLLEKLLEPLQRRAQLARVVSDWFTHDTLQQACLDIVTPLWQTDAFFYKHKVLSAQIHLLDSACSRGDNTGAEEYAASVVETVCKTREQAANYVGYSQLIKQLAAAGQHVKRIDSQATYEKLMEELVKTARDGLSKGLENNAERMETVAATLGEAGLDAEAKEFRNKARAIRERKSGTDTSAP